ncbi:DUF3617 domain-containing protein [Erythrobacter litoralis]|uniref:DUF3617 domain-containing protein n=1 Tax=Erythrobacter litoralis (strain HTCC2594) TaxID=314225 RepID=Q2N8T2_ERYLH|nr:DUF3617 domain-containing protein [Erythrobacter litoralis]ABC63909.1 hypothetical protein ELI_09085 [Erythrobacter litoralis HTCC2594]
MFLTRALASAAALGGCAALLAGCGEEQPLTDEAVLSEARELERPRAGLYTTTTDLVEFSVPGLAPEQADRMRMQMSGLSDEAQPYCLTEAEAAKGYEDMLREIGEAANNMSCTFSRFDADPPRLDAELGCSGPMGVSAEIAMAGTTTAEGFDLTMDMEANNRMIPGGKMEMRMAIKSARIGECSGQDLADAEATAAE